MLKFRHRQATSDAPLKGTNQTRQEQELEWQRIKTTVRCHLMSLHVTWCCLLFDFGWTCVQSPNHVSWCFCARWMAPLRFDGFPRDVLRGNAPHQCCMMPFKLGKKDVEVQQPIRSSRHWVADRTYSAQWCSFAKKDQLRAAGLQKTSCSHPLPLGWANSFCISFLSFMSITLYSSTENGPCPLQKLTVLGAFSRYFKDMCAPQYTINLCPPALLSALRRCLFRSIFDCAFHSSFSLLTLAARILFCLFGFLDQKLEP